MIKPAPQNPGEPRGNLSLPFSVILQMAIEGDEKAFRDIYTMLSGKMYSLCVRYTGNTNDADDVFQEGLIRLYRNLNKFQGTGSFEGWARRIFVNSCLDYLKQRQKLVYTELSDNNDVPTSELSGIDKVTKDDLLKLIQQLPGGYRLIVNLYLVEGYNHKEIGEMLGISEGTSKSQLSRARVILQKHILELNG
ncbi:MAG: RNA polymerase sigma factor [Chitinophagaceae bacterium]|nr:RNA polymerase sigma factor [Chitinophagaceae bacterium]